MNHLRIFPSRFVAKLTSFREIFLFCGSSIVLREISTIFLKRLIFYSALCNHIKDQYWPNYKDCSLIRFFLNLNTSGFISEVRSTARSLLLNYFPLSAIILQMAAESQLFYLLITEMLEKCHKCKMYSPSKSHY